MRQLTLIVLTLVFFLFLFCMNNLYGQSKIRAKQYAQLAGNEIYKKLAPQTGKDLIVEIIDGEIEIKVRFSSLCELRGRDEATIKGVLEVDFEGCNVKFTVSEKNDRVICLERWNGLISGITFNCLR